MKINKYWSKTKRTYTRKNKFNKTYRGGKTLHTKETEKAFGKFLIALIVFAYCSAGAYSLASNTRTITIQGGGAVSPETAKQALREGVVGADNSPTTAPVDYSGIPYIEKDKGTVEERIKKAFPEDPNTALAIAKCESMLDKNAIGDTHTKYCSVGIMQIRTLPKRMAYYGLTIEKLKDVNTNLEMARKIKDRRGNWGAWSCFTSGEYKKHL